MPVSCLQVLRASVILTKPIQPMNHHLSEVAFVSWIPEISICTFASSALTQCRSCVQSLMKCSLSHLALPCRIQFKRLTNKNVPGMSVYVCKRQLLCQLCLGFVQCQSRLELLLSLFNEGTSFLTSASLLQPWQLQELDRREIKIYCFFLIICTPISAVLPFERGLPRLQLHLVPIQLFRPLPEKL